MSAASQEIKEIVRVYAGLETLYQAYFPKTDPYLIHDLLRRLKKNKVRVYDYIKHHPGSHLRKISKELDITTSDTQYWCNRLEKVALVRSRSLGLYKTYYPASIVGERRQYILAILQQKTPRTIVLYLMENSGASQKDITQHTGFAAATISWHMSRLIEIGIVYSSKEGKFVKYYIRGDIADLVTLLKSYYPSIWD